MPSKNETIISPISIDLGAISTGVVLTSYPEGEDFRDVKALGTCLEIDTNSMVLSQAGRLAKRHQRRGYKRRKMAKRLLFLILRQHYKVESIPPETAAFLRGLMNRRGFTYASEELSQQDLTGADIDAIRLFFPDMEDTDNLYKYLLEQAQDKDWVHTMADRIDKMKLLTSKGEPAKSEIQKVLNNSGKYEQSEVDTIKETVMAVVSYIYNSRKSIDDGARHRRVYFERIEKDIQKLKDKWKPIQKATRLDAKKLTNLIGNISNLQLRVLRKYFNDIQMAKGDYWDSDRLQRMLRKYFRAWHVDSKTDHERKTRHYQLLKDQKTDLLEWLTETDPNETVPPYEDMNNRRIPACKSLLIDFDRLNDSYKDWHLWTRKLTEYLQFLDQTEKTLDVATGSVDRSHQLRDGDREPSADVKSDRELADQLQRILDLSATIDPFLLRYQATRRGNFPKQKVAEAEDRLKQALGNHKDSFLKFAREYYEDVADARQGVLETGKKATTRVVLLCGSKTKKKSNIKRVLVSQILGDPALTDAEFESFMTGSWKDRFDGVRTIKSYCKALEDIRKKDGTAFQMTLNRVKRIINEYLKEKRADESEKVDFEKATEKELKNIFSGSDNKDDLDLAKLIVLTTKAAEKIAESVPGYLDRYSARTGIPIDKIDMRNLPFANVFSMAQLYNILEGDTGGYSKTCNACNEENAWRSMVLHSNEFNTTGARASRLPADSVRPFDGMLRRLMERTGKEIAALKFQELKSKNILGNKKIRIPIIVEQNAFDFTEDLGQMKKDQGLTIQANNAKKKAQKIKENQEKQGKFFEKKQTRIKQAAGGICAYSKSKVTLTDTNGEVDHIIPRSMSRDMSGTIFNSEMNLIYVSSTANQKKGARLYSLEDLNKDYLKNQFGTSDVKAIRESIAATLKKLEKQRRRAFHSYSRDEQIALRHSLFDSELRQTSLEYLNMQSMTRVNGTQANLIRHIMAELKAMVDSAGFESKNIEFDVLKPEARAVSDLRKLLAAKFPDYDKPKDGGQNPGSHVIDATMAFASLLRETKNIEAIRTVPFAEGTTDESLAKDLAGMIPKRLDIKNVTNIAKYRKPHLGGRSLFKDGIYGERFVPLLADDGDLKIGFDKNNAIQIKEHSEWIFENLKPFLKYPEIETYSLEQLLEKSQDKLLVLGIARQSALDYLFEKKGKPDELVALLNALRYSVKKTDLVSESIEQNGKFKGWAGIIDTDKKFNIKMEFSTPAAKGKITGRLLFPARKDWQALQSAIAKHKSLRIGEKVDEHELRSWLEEYFIDKQNPYYQQKMDRSHAGVRKVFSLPVIDNPSGGFRIKRETMDGETVYQVVVVDDASYAGFIVSSKNLALKKDNLQLIQKIDKSKNVVPVKLQNGKEGDILVWFDEYLQVDFPGLESGEHLYVAPYSSSRFSYRLRILKNRFKKLVDFNFTNIQSIPARFDLVEGKNMDLVIDGLPKYRSDSKNNIKLHSIDDEFIEIEYNGPSNDIIKSLYIKARFPETINS